MSPQATVPVTLHVPEPLVLQFQARAVELIRELATTGAESTSPAVNDSWPVAPTEARGRPLWEGESLKWGTAEDDFERAVWVLKNSTNRALKLIAAMVRNAGAQVTGKELGDQAGYAKGARSVAPVLGAIGLRCRQVNRSAIWGWRAGANDNEASTYEMPTETAQLFEKALDRARPDWRDSAN